MQAFTVQPIHVCWVRPPPLHLQVSAQLVPFDAALQTLLAISGVLFLTWFLVHLKNILIRCVGVSVCVWGGWARQREER
jgi:hypothetical protein